MGPAFLSSSRVGREHQLSADRALASPGIVEMANPPVDHWCHIMPEAACGHQVYGRSWEWVQRLKPVLRVPGGAEATASPACPALPDTWGRGWASIPMAPLGFSEHLLGIPKRPSVFPSGRQKGRTVGR